MPDHSVKEAEKRHLSNMIAWTDFYMLIPFLKIFNDCENNTVTSKTSTCKNIDINVSYIYVSINCYVVCN